MTKCPSEAITRRHHAALRFPIIPRSLHAPSERLGVGGRVDEEGDGVKHPVPERLPHTRHALDVQPRGANAVFSRSLIYFSTSPSTERRYCNFRILIKAGGFSFPLWSNGLTTHAMARSVEHGRRVDGCMSGRGKIQTKSVRLWLHVVKETALAKEDACSDRPWHANP